MQRTVSVPSLDHLDDLHSTFRGLYPDHQVFAFQGQLGAGKTTLIKSLCTDLGVEDDMSSPSFALVNAYESDLASVFHFDLYRLKHVDELLDIGWYDYLDVGDVIFIEWPEIAKDHLPDDTVFVDIEVDTKDDSRTLTLTYTS